MEKISVFGAGFIGGKFADAYPDDVHIMQRESRIPHTNNILNFVSTVDNYNVKTDIHIDVETNITIMLQILDSARKKFGNHFIFNQISTWFVYGNTRLPATEDERCNPAGFYSITKRAAEELLISYCKTFDIQYRILRLANVIGIGDKKISRKKNAIQFMIRELAHGKEIELYKNGSIRDVIDVRDCIRAIRLVMDKGKTNQIYNIANGQGLNTKDLIEDGWRACGFTGTIKHIDVPDFHKIVQTPKMWLDISKIKKLGYVQEYDIRQSIKNLAEYYKTHDE